MCKLSLNRLLSPIPELCEQGHYILQYVYKNYTYEFIADLCMFMNFFK